MVDSIIFDMDGTLVNNLKQMVVSWNLTCKRYGWDKEITYEEMKSCMGLNGHDIGVKLFPNIDEDEATRRVEVCSAEEVDYFDQVEIGYTYIPSLILNVILDTVASGLGQEAVAPIQFL